MDFDINFYPELFSTNETLADMNSKTDLAEGTVIQTGFQKHGKGYAGSKWQSEANKNLLFSILVKPHFLSPEHQFDISRIFCMSLKDLIQPHCPMVKIKWPNDIFIKNRKVAGILIENSIQGDIILNSIAGVGLNVNQASFDPAIPSPTSLFLEKGCHFDIQKLLQELLEIFSNWYEKLKSGQYREIRRSYLEDLFLRDIWTDFQTNDRALHARIIDVLPGGELLLESSGGQKQTYGFKEIEYIN